MSLFKTREFWLTNCDADKEEFDGFSLKVTKLNDDRDHIITGSHKGILRIFMPAGLTEKNALVDYQPTDLLIEKNLNAPISQMEVGKLVSGSMLRQIAILHPTNFAVYAFTTKKGQTEEGNQNMVNLLYQHKLTRAAASFAVGPFGGTINRDFIAVQSLDGMLSFYEQETFVFCCFLPNFLLPAAFVYVRRTDSLLIGGSDFTINCYSYKSLFSCGQSSEENNAGGMKCLSDWRLNVSENIMDIHYMYDGFSRESYLVAMGERNFFCLNDGGKMKFMKRLDFAPICSTCYLIGENVMTLIVSETRTLLIYESTTLKWSAQLPDLPIAIQRGTFGCLKGVLVTLTEEGFLKCSFLGTHPNLFSAPPLKGHTLDYEKSNEELAVLGAIIKGARNEVANHGHQELSISIAAQENSIGDKEVTIEITIEPVDLFEEINVSLNTMPPLISDPKCVFFRNVSQRLTFHVNVYAKEDISEIITSLSLQLVASCVKENGTSKVFCKSFPLPSRFFLKTVKPTRENDVKIILNASGNFLASGNSLGEYANLAELFSEFMDENATPNTIALSSHSNKSVHNYVTILIAKSSQRYRLQSDSLAALNICVEEIKGKLKERNKTNKNFDLNFNGAQLPIKDLLSIIRLHFDCRSAIKMLERELRELGAQFRCIQKRLIAKFKDRHPTPLNNLSMLLQDTYREILNVTTQLEEYYVDMEKIQIKLSCALMLIVNLLSMTNQCSDVLQHHLMFSNIFYPIVQELDDLAWEDTLEAALEYVLRTFLAKSEKDKLRQLSSHYEEVKDISKLERHIGSVLDRILKSGLKLEAGESDKPEYNSYNRVIKHAPSAIGTKFGESSSRVLSASHQKSQSMKLIDERIAEDKSDDVV